MNIFRRPHGYLHLRRPKEKAQSHRSIYDYIRCGEISEKVGCSIRSAWVGAGALEQPSMIVVTVKFGGFQGGLVEHKISFSLGGPGFPVMSRRIARRFSSLI